MLNDVPYAALVELAEAATEAEREEEEAKWQRAAFVGWQHYLCQPVGKGRAHMGFGRWLEMLGLENESEDDWTEERKAQEKAKAEANAAKVRERFKRRSKG